MDNTIVNAVQTALEGNAAEYQAAVEAALNAKAEAAIEERKKEIELEFFHYHIADNLDAIEYYKYIGKIDGYNDIIYLLSK
jgi:hypothetical protein